ncbi:hypothetical protein S40293_05817 [Stachybotrys chartarum IBT 40293]|nr:hypothetical protein S40293_05817 [Stachybotrys chartarum IBT 40293]
MAARRDQEADFWDFVSSFRPDATGPGVNRSDSRGGLGQFPLDMFLSLPGLQGLQGGADPRGNPWAAHMDAFARSFGQPPRDQPWPRQEEAQAGPAAGDKSAPPASDAESSDTEGVRTPATAQTDAPDPVEVVPEDDLASEGFAPRHPDPAPPLPGRRPGPGRGRGHRGPRGGWYYPDPFDRHHHRPHPRRPHEYAPPHPHPPPPPHPPHGFPSPPPPPPPPRHPHGPPPGVPQEPPHDAPHGPRHGPRHGPPHGHGPFFPPSPWNIAELWERFAESLAASPQDTSTPKPEAPTNGFNPPVDVFSTECAFVVHISLPGAKKQDVSLDWSQERRTLKVAGVVHRPGDEEFLRSQVVSERRFGYFERDIVLSSEAGARDEVDGLAISAKMEDGILTVTLPKLEKEWTEVQSVDIE